MKTDQKYYAHFNKDTKRIYSVGNNFSKSYHKNSVEISEKEYVNFVEGKTQTHSFFVDRKKVNGKLTNILVPILGAEETASNNVYAIIDSKPTKSTELIVSWEQDKWTFTLTNKFKNYSEEESNVPLLFFVVDTNNLSRLFRTISIPYDDLVSTGVVTVQTTCKEEASIDSIKIVTRAVFKEYGLEIHD